MRRILLLALPTMLGAQSVPGHWVVRTDNISKSTAKSSAMISHMNEVMDVLRRDPSLDHPSGFTVLAHIGAAQSSPAKMVTGTLRTLLVAHGTNDDGSVDASGNGEGLGFTIQVNEIGCALGDHTEYRDAEGGMYTALVPRVFHGMPMYREGGCILITKRSASPTIPVTRERAMRALIKENSGQPQVAAALEKQLNAMPAAERNAPAIVDIGALTSMQSGEKTDAPVLVSTESQTAVRLVSANPAFYDRSRLGEIQVIAVSFDCWNGHGSQWCAQYPGLFERIRDSIDWNALARLVQP